MGTVTRMSGDERRAAIMEAAVCLFAERGFRGTTTRALAEACGVTEPVLYEHFKSKRDLYTAIVEVKSREGWERGTTLLEPLKAARNDRAFFVTLGQVILGKYTQNQAYARLLFFAALEDPELGRLFYERQQQAREAIADYIATRIEEGAFRPVNPKVAARTFIGMIVYHGLQGMLYKDDFLQLSSDEAVKAMVDIFLHGILAH